MTWNRAFGTILATIATAGIFFGGSCNRNESYQEKPADVRDVSGLERAVGIPSYELNPWESQYLRDGKLDRLELKTMAKYFFEENSYLFGIRDPHFKAREGKEYIVRDVDVNEKRVYFEMGENKYVFQLLPSNEGAIIERIYK